MANDGCGSGCGCSGGCGAPKRQLFIDYLYLDLEVCDRCKGTEAVLNAAIDDVLKVLDAIGVELIVNNLLIDTKEKAMACRLMSSPTIRIDGRDIDVDIKETPCTTCGDLCGDDVDCRTWVYQGQEYSVPPKALIVNAILGAVYGSAPEPDQTPYTMPENLKKFFDARGEKQQ